MNEMRLQKYLARAGAASRRASEELILAGRVTVNGEVSAELGVKVDADADEVRLDGVLVSLAPRTTTIMLNKPLGYVTSMKDEHAAHVVSELVPCGEYPGLFPLGRLDRDTSGLLLFSTDGDLGHALLRPRGHVTKHYLALVDGMPTEGELERLRCGVQLDDGPTLPAQVELLRDDAARAALRQLEVPADLAKKTRDAAVRESRRRGWGDDSDIVKRAAAWQHDALKGRSVVRLGIHEGRNRQVRRMLGKVGHPVVALHRESFGPIGLGDLPRGSWRVLSDAEVDALRVAVQRAGD